MYIVLMIKERSTKIIYSNIHHQISLILLNEFPSTIYLSFLQINVYYAELEKNAQVSIYSLADLNIGNCVESTVLRTSVGRFFCDKGLKI